MRDLFQKEVPQAPRKNLMAMYKNVSDGYYGVTGEDEEDILEDELKYEESMR